MHLVAMHVRNQTWPLSTLARDVSEGLAPLVAACCTAGVCSEIVMASEGLSSNVIRSGAACAPASAASHHRLPVGGAGWHRHICVDSSQRCVLSGQQMSKQTPAQANHFVQCQMLHSQHPLGSSSQVLIPD